MLCHKPLECFSIWNFFKLEVLEKNSHLGKVWPYFATALDFSVGCLLLEMFRVIFVCVLSYAAKKTVLNRTNCLVPGRRSDLESENSLLLGGLSTKEQSPEDTSLHCAPPEVMSSQDVCLRKHNCVRQSLVKCLVLCFPRIRVLWVLLFLWIRWLGRQGPWVFPAPACKKEESC